jgi:hypothetical protein
MEKSGELLQCCKRSVGIFEGAAGLDVSTPVLAQLAV